MSAKTRRGADVGDLVASFVASAVVAAADASLTTVASVVIINTDATRYDHHLSTYYELAAVRPPIMTDGDDRGSLAMCVVSY